MIQNHSTPTEEELKEFYLCGIRLAYAKKKELNLNLSNPFGSKAYKCEYCPSWHEIPGLKNEEALLKEANLKFNEHMNVLLDKTNSTPTSAIVILSSN